MKYSAKKWCRCKKTKKEQVCKDRGDTSDECKNYVKVLDTKCKAVAACHSEDSLCVDKVEDESASCRDDCDCDGQRLCNGSGKCENQPKPVEEKEEPEKQEEETVEPEKPDEETVEPENPDEETVQPEEPDEETVEPENPDEETVEPENPDEETVEPEKPDEETVQPEKPEEPKEGQDEVESVSEELEGLCNEDCSAP